MTIMLALKIGVFFMFFHLSVSKRVPIVSTSLGEIKGHYKFSPTGRKYEAYEGIPYAEPPVGRNRFQPPIPVKPRPGVILANRVKPLCWINAPFPPTQPDIRGDEDCLYLNVYVPEKKSRKALPVIIYIYGGSFQTTTLGIDDEKNLMDRDVIFIIFAYRHGTLGFLSTEDDVVPGNMGLKDQALALKWVKNNIEAFGGDPDRITLVGLSAGGASVQYHYLSPMSRGLFNAGISISGTVLMPWAQTENSREKAIKVAELLNCPTFDMEEMVECLRLVPARKLVETQGNFTGWRQVDFTPFGPVVEKNPKGAFLSRPPVEIINSGDAQDLPWITGIVSEEGLCPIAEFITNKTLLKELDDDWEKIAPYLLQYYYTIEKNKHASVARKIKKYFFGDEPIYNNLPALIQMHSERVFQIYAVKAAVLQAEYYDSPVWFYYFGYRGDWGSFSNFLSHSKKNFGVAHSDDNILAFSHNLKSEDDLEMKEKLIDIWVSVAHTGKPNSKLDWTWLQYNRDFEYLNITGPRNLNMINSQLMVNNHFWNSLGFNENEKLKL